jgi:hypothetical protein
MQYHKTLPGCGRQRIRQATSGIAAARSAHLPGCAGKDRWIDGECNGFTIRLDAVVPRHRNFKGMLTLRKDLDFALHQLQRNDELRSENLLALQTLIKDYSLGREELRQCAERWELAGHADKAELCLANIQ